MTEEGTSLEQMLDQYSVAPASAQLRARILAAAPKERKAGWLEILRDEIFGWRPALPALGLALCLGIAFGLMEESEDAGDLVQMAAYQQDLEEEY